MKYLERNAYGDGRLVGTGSGAGLLRGRSIALRTSRANWQIVLLLQGEDLVLDGSGVLVALELSNLGIVDSRVGQHCAIVERHSVDRGHLPEKVPPVGCWRQVMRNSASPCGMAPSVLAPLLDPDPASDILIVFDGFGVKIEVLHCIS